jgi:hypothetical protein
MYSSLHKVDIVVKEKDGSGKLFVQTDHRSVEEVAAEVEVSVLFALARTIVPKRMSDAAGVKVRYACLGGLHPAIAEVLLATGAEPDGMEGVAKPSLDGVKRRATADLADEAFAALGQKLLARHALSADEAGLAAFEATIDEAPSQEQDEIAYWTTVAELAAVTGEVLRAKCGGRWIDDPKDFADIPFLFQPARNEGMVNPVGKAMKFLMHGAAESPQQLLRMVEDNAEPEGPLLFSLKPSNWAARAEAVCEPLMARMEKAGADVPIIVYGHDKPNTFGFFMKGGRFGEDTVALRKEALANLARVKVEVERIDLSALTFWVVQGSYFAAEKILDVDFMKELHRRLESPLLAAAVPEKGQLLVTSAVAGPEKMLPFMALANGIYERNNAGRQISPTVFLVSDGAIQGVAKRGEEPAKLGGDDANGKKGFLKRLFS